MFENSLPRLAVTKVLGAVTPRAFVGPAAPLRLRSIPEPVLPRDDWVVVRTRYAGLCGSDYKQVFLHGAYDNPMTSVISFPHVLGHEVVGVVERVGPAVERLAEGQRVVLNPWLSCAPRGLSPCEECSAGELSQCLRFTEGGLDKGIHTGNCATASGAFAPLFPAHESQCFVVPDGVGDEAAVLADPFSVSLHAIVRHPPKGGTALVYGAGTLGLLSVAILRHLHPDTHVIAVARYPHQAEQARAFGAQDVLQHRPLEALVEAVARSTGAKLRKPWRGLPMLDGGAGVIYDTVGSAETLEVGVRVTRPRGRIVVTGVEIPRRFEWTPLYFKEISLIGSNAFGVETVGGVRKHAIEHYFDLSSRIDATRILTHRFALRDYARAFMACWDQGKSGAIKVLLEPA